MSALKGFLSQLPKRIRLAIEVRSKSWFVERFYSLLRDHGVALAMIDTPGVPSHEVITSNFAYVRWEGDRRKIRGDLGTVELDRRSDVETWAGKIEKLLGDSMEVFGYYSKYYSGHPPTDARQLLGFLSGSAR